MSEERAEDGWRMRALRRALVAGLREQDAIRTDRVDAALRAVPRHLFVPGVSPVLAYADTVVPTKYDHAGEPVSALSQPTIVAVMLEQLDVRPGMRVLEIGAGTGYNAALLACLAGTAGHVVSVDVDADLVEQARSHLSAAAAVGLEVARGVQVEQGDGALGYPSAAPYDRIIVTVGAGDVPSAWLGQLAPGGRLVVPLRIRGGVTRSLAWEREGDGVWCARRPEVCSFMPLRGIADDLGRSIDLTADGLVGLRLHREQIADDEALGRALQQPAVQIFTGVGFGDRDSFEDLDLYLTCTLPGAMAQMAASGPAVESGLVLPQFVWGAMCTVEGGSLAYLTLRRTADDVRPWEAGVVGHGPRAAEIAEQVVQAARTWDTEIRGGESVFRLAQGDWRERLTGRCLVDKPISRIAVDWERAGAAA
jgi:protein-L-isoaspartate(D-aspartate) O-methyltransferase